MVEAVDHRPWYARNRIFFDPQAQVTLELLAGIYGSVTLMSAKGNTELPADFCFEATTTGDIKIYEP